MDLVELSKRCEHVGRLKALKDVLDKINEYYEANCPDYNEHIENIFQIVKEMNE